MPDDIKINILSDGENLKRAGLGKPEQSLQPEKEKKPETTPQDRENVLSEIAEAEKAGSQTQAVPIVNRARDEKKIRGKKIEKILEKNLEELYIHMPPDKKTKFKNLGEQTANQINNLLDKTKIKIKEVIDLIRKWLLIIPGINKFFLEQEVKIKADEIIKLK